jgi:hypothetical protein
MRTIKELLPKPSDAIKAMLAGLQKADHERGFQIDMSTYGSALQDDDSFQVTCFGCAATCTVQHLLGRPFVPEEIDDRAKHAAALDMLWYEVSSFESAIDNFRTGYLSVLFRFYDLELNQQKYNELEDHVDKWIYLQTHNWTQQIPAIEKAIKMMEELGI